MTDTEPVGINATRLERIPNPWNETFSSTDLPQASAIIGSVFKQDLNDRTGSEVARAQVHKDYIGFSQAELHEKVPALINSCLSEMLSYETVGREPAELRLTKLKTIAPSITHVIDRSAPGDYYHLNKNDKYKHDPAMQGGDRVRSDQAAILAIVLAGIKENWPDEDLLLFLNQHVLTNDNEALNALREKAKQAVTSSGIRIAYSGEAHEINPIKIALSQKNVFIPKESVDFVGPEGIHDTFTQGVEFKKYLEANIVPGNSFIEPINLQGIRASRMAQTIGMVPPETNYFIYAMPTTKHESMPYRENEIKGTVWYALTGKGSFDPVSHTLI